MVASVRRLRLARKMTQVDLAEAMSGRAGWTATTVAWVETGRRRLTAAELLHLCEVLRCRPHALVEGIDQAPVVSRDLDEVVGQAVRDEERKNAKRLGVSVEQFRALVQARYGRTFRDERDSRAKVTRRMSQRTAQAKRGHATRRIIEELRQA